MASFCVKKNWDFPPPPTGDPRQLQLMSRIIKIWQEKQLCSKIVSLDRKTVRYAKTKGCFKHATYSLKKLWSDFFSQMLLSLPKLAVKNNSSKKNTQMWAKTHKWWIFQRKVDLSRSRTRSGSHTPSDPVSMLPVCLLLDLTTRLATWPLNVSYCVKNN